jgi:PilZ domain
MGHQVSSKEAKPLEDDSRSYVRRTSRFDVDMRVRVTPDKDDTPVYWFGQANDIGEFGMSLFVPTALELGTVVRIDFNLPYCSQKITLRATVRNRSSFRYGIEFYYPTRLEREMILRACKMMSVLQ